MNMKRTEEKYTATRYTKYTERGNHEQVQWGTPLIGKPSTLMENPY